MTEDKNINIKKVKNGYVISKETYTKKSGYKTDTYIAKDKKEANKKATDLL